MNFQEKQRINKWWLIAILILPCALLLSIQIFDGFTGTKSFLVPLTIISISAIVLIFLLSLQLTITADQQGIVIKMTYFSTVSIPYTTIKSITVKSISPIGEFGGYGYRYNLSKGITGYIITGKKGVFIETNSGKKIAFTIVNELDFLHLIRPFCGEKMLQKN
jgi:hypothetical protein